MSEKSDERFVDRESASNEEGASRENGDAAAAADDAATPDQAADATASEAEGKTPETTDDVNELKALAEQYRTNWQRSAADFANYRRRVEEERKDTARLANASLAFNLLPVYDDLERAVNTVDAKLAGLNWVQGVEAIHRKFWHVLESMGIEEIPAEGEQFDPECHEAVGEQAGEEGKVLHVAQKGYRLGGKVLRPSMVIVGNGGAPAEETTSEEA